MALAAIALGSNLPGALGSREANLTAAIREIERLGNVLSASSLVETAPVGYLDQPAFLNGAVVLDTWLAPGPLLLELLEIESQLGRDRSHGIARGPRSLDLDLLLYDEFVVVTPELVLPHPEMHRRSFVLEPLAEIAPTWMHPVKHRTIEQLLRALTAGVC